MSSRPAPSAAPGFLRHVLNYGAVSVLQKAIALAMLPLYTRWLVESEYGAIAITGFVLVILSELFGRHLLAGMSRQYFLAEDDSGRRAVVSTTTLVVFAVALVVCGLALVFSDALVPLLLGRGDEHVGPTQLSTLFLLTALILPCQLASQAGFSYLLIQKHSQLWAGVHLAKMALELTLKIVLVGVLQRGVEGYLVSILVGELVTTIGLTGSVLLRVGFRIDRRTLDAILRFALPLLPVGLLQLGLHQLDRRLLEHLAPDDLGLTWAGVYGLGYLVAATPAGVLLNALFAAWQPTLYAIEDEEKRRATLARETTWTVLALTAICIVTCFAGRPLVDLLAGREGYRAASAVVPWIACGYVFWGLYAAIQLGFYAEQRTGALVRLNFVALVTNVVLNFLLIPHFGTTGAAIATLGTFALLAALAAAASRRVVRHSLETGRIAAALALALVATFVALELERATADWSIVATLTLRILCTTGLLALVFVALLRKSERDLVISLAARALRRFVRVPQRRDAS